MGYYRAEATAADPRTDEGMRQEPIYQAKDCTHREGLAFCFEWAKQGYFAAIYHPDGECIFELKPKEC